MNNQKLREAFAAEVKKHQKEFAIPDGAIDILAGKADEESMKLFERSIVSDPLFKYFISKKRHVD